MNFSVEPGCPFFVFSKVKQPQQVRRQVMAEKEKTYTYAEIPAKLAEHGLTGWYLDDGWIRRKFTTEGWQTSLLLVNAIGYLAEAAYHHPDLAVTWGKVWVKLKTHSAGGITDKDLALAKKIEEVVLWRPPAGGPLDGTPNKFVKGG
jgi:4a-hydroxytetrahydrobiopterin dehydratase